MPDREGVNLPNVEDRLKVLSSKIRALKKTLKELQLAEDRLHSILTEASGVPENSIRKPKVALSCKVSKLELGQEIVEKLHALEVKKLKDLENIKEAELLHAGIGRKTINHLKILLLAHHTGIKTH